MNYLEQKNYKKIFHSVTLSQKVLWSKSEIKQNKEYLKYITLVLGKLWILPFMDKINAQNMGGCNPGLRIVMKKMKHNGNDLNFY